MQAFKTEIKTFLKSKITVAGTAAFVFLIIGITFLSYSSGADTIRREIDSDNGAFPVSSAIASRLTVLFPSLGINNALAAALVVGLIILPILAAAFVGTDYSQKTMYLKLEVYKLRTIILSKIVVFTGYVMLLTAFTSGLGFILGRILWNIYIEPIPGVSVYFKGVTAGTNHWMILLTFLALMFYSLIAVLVSLIFKNAAAGVAASLLFCYFEEYVRFRYMPRWLFFNILGRVYYFNEYSTTQYKMLHAMTGTPVWLCITLLMSEPAESIIM
jgi:hypothetical protein